MGVQHKILLVCDNFCHTLGTKKSPCYIAILSQLRILLVCDNFCHTLGTIKSPCYIEAAQDFVGMWQFLSHIADKKITLLYFHGAAILSQLNILLVCDNFCHIGHKKLPLLFSSSILSQLKFLLLWDNFCHTPGTKNFPH